MSRGFYSKIALRGISKNKRIYFPYILTGIVMIMMVYILFFLSGLDAMEDLKGGGTLRVVLPLGGYIVSVFALLFLFYSNSYIIRQRNKEFGLYNILGMDKGNLRKIVLLEGLLSGFISLSAGLLLGIAFSKAAELILYNLLTVDITYTLQIDASAVAKTALIFAGIYVILLMNSVIKVSRSNPLELLHSANVGEKPPKANWVLAVIGVLLLAVAYDIALSIKQPLLAMLWFAAAVVMVIVATYLLFISGSVAICRLLQKNKKYYYKPNHFVSVSSMVYRMKRNGAGLASICVLMTMVLVTLSATFSLYIGAEDSLNARFPTDIQMNLFVAKPEYLTEENFTKMRNGVDRFVPERQNVIEYAAVQITGLFSESGITVDQSTANMTVSDYDSLGFVSIITLDDYNRLMGTHETLDDGECLLHGSLTGSLSGYVAGFSGRTFTIEHCAPLKVKKTVENMFVSGYANMQVVPTITLITADINAVVEPLVSMADSYGDFDIQCYWSCNFDVDGTPEDEIAIRDVLWKHMDEIVLHTEDGSYGYYLDCKEADRAELLANYAGMLFIGVLLSIVFMFAAVLIIYYKQISEGYEDQKRFDVMQKVGMTKLNIRKSVNSQVLTVFFMPMLLAGLHLAFAFPMLWKILQILGFRNLGLMIAVTAVCFAVFALVYAIVYKITSHIYYSIVSDREDA